MATKVTFKQGEAKPLTLRLFLKKVAWPIPDNTEFTLGVKKTKQDSSYAFSHEDADFTVVNQAGGIISVGITESDLTREAGAYVGELKVETADGTIDKSLDLDFIIEKAVID